MNSASSVGANGSSATVPASAPSQVIRTASIRASSSFCSSRPKAYSTAESTASATPSRSACPVNPPAAIRATPTNLIEACTAAGFSPIFGVEAHDYPTAIAFVGAGIGPTVLPALAAARLPDGVTSARLLRPTPIRSIQVVVPDAVAHTPPVRTAVAALREAARPR
ncbi:LysR substrate-binding domain-containing protein [Micromonospora radicis]|uniref:LysR substrate-binding domain-containing protein n=1 Tax=Micromonospora radicis TaxID=1894971 RepID=UPI001F196DED|nr:LysR substrate-binding domain-containing protein [Micromonospora radicis]